MNVQATLHGYRVQFLELTFSEDGLSETESENKENVDKLAIKRIIGDKLATMRQIESKIGDNSALPTKNSDKLPIKICNYR